jgi:hypothetical protein
MGWKREFLSVSRARRRAKGPTAHRYRRLLTATPNAPSRLRGARAVVLAPLPADRYFCPMRKAFLIGLLSSIFLLSVKAGGPRIFHDHNDREISAEVTRVRDRTATLRRADGKVFQVAFDNLSEEDVAYLKQWAEDHPDLLDLTPGAVTAADTDGPSAVNERIVAFIETNMGKKVGNGQCWTLANQAFISADTKRPAGLGLRVWGRLVDPKEEDVLPGDIVEYDRGKDAKFPAHTAVVYERVRRGQFVLAEQNWNGNLFVTTRKFEPEKAVESKKEKVMIYRPPGD